jgi:transcriptional regulator with XRE-family HTH domain
MVGEAKRAAIRRQYRLWRTAVEKTQIDVELLARLDAGRYWKIENAVVFPTDEERIRLARVLKVNEADIPSEHVEAKAS